MLANRELIIRAMELSDEQCRQIMRDSGYSVSDRECWDFEFRGFDGRDWVYSFKYENGEDWATGEIFFRLKRKVLSSEYHFTCEY